MDDFEPWRDFVCSTLAEQPGIQVVGEACDGLAGIDKAQELRPDLILLDIGLPKMNGLECAGRIHEVAPQSKILFASENSDPDVVQQALSDGAYGYLLKIDANRELLDAVKVVLEGNRFVSRRLSEIHR